MKTYPLQFIINGINYTANLLDVDLQELLSIFESGYDPKIPSTLISRAKLREAEQFLNESRVSPSLPNLVEHSDFNARMTLYKAVAAVTLISLKDTAPNWEFTPEQTQIINEYEASLVKSSRVAELYAVETIEVANADTITD